MRARSVVVMGIAAIALPLVVAAADVPVSYTVDEKDLKDAVSGTNLTFELFGENTCTTVLHTDVVAIDDLLVSKLKRFKPSGGTKPPKTAELRTTLPGVGVSGNLYLEVTGTGVTPVGGACQAQAAQGAPPPTCFDTIENQDETDVDCGGAICGGCSSGEDCLASTDCISGICTGSVCQGTCFDGEANQDETGVDCGGATCVARCQPGQGCLGLSDCDTGHPQPVACVNNVCAFHCQDGQMNAGETGVDCGGTCASEQLCPAGQGCASNGDCQSNSCMAGVCQ